MSEAFICDAVRTPFGRHGGVLAGVRADDLAAVPMRALVERNPSVRWAALDDVIYGCANQAGEDNRNVARMGALLAGLPIEVPGMTMNRLCGSGLDAVAAAARMIRSGEAELLIAGGVESMSRAPYVLSKADAAYGRNQQIHDTTIGWRFVNPLLKDQYGVDSMPETGENVAADFEVSRADQDAFALRSQQRALAAQASGVLAEEIVPVTLPVRKGEPVVVARDEHPRETSLEALARLPTPFRAGGTVTAGNASGVNDGACALLIASERAVRQYSLKPMSRIAGAAVAGVAPRIMGIGPAPASRKLLDRLGLGIDRPERRRDRARSSAGRERRPARHYGRAPARAHGRAVRAVHHVHRRRPGHRTGPRTRIRGQGHESRKLCPGPMAGRHWGCRHAQGRDDG
jgi:acetyl-CoA acyltransferase